MINNVFDRTANENKTIGVEFVDGRLRLIQFQRSGDTYVLRSFAEKDLPADSYINNQITNPAVVGELLQKAMQETLPQKPDTTYVICLIPQKDIFLITQELPKVSAEEAQSVIGNKIGDLIPMAAADVYWDWRVVMEYGSKMQVQIAASPKELIDSYMKCFDEAKLVPLIFEPSAEAASRVGGIGNDNENLLLMELGEKSAIVSVTRNQIVVFSTDVPLEVSPSGEVNTNQLINRVQEIVAYIQQQSRQQFAFNPNARIYGRTDMVDKVLKALATVNSQFKFSRIRYQKSANNRISEFIPKLDNYVPLVGAAIRGLPNYWETAASINLVPDEAKKAFSQRQIKSTITRFTFFFMLDAMLVLIAMVVLFSRAQDELSTHADILQQARSISETGAISNLRENISNVNKRSATIKTITEQMYAWDRVVIAISEVTPDDLQFEQIRLAPNPEKKGRYEFSIEGTFVERNSALEFSRRMRELPFFESVALPVGSLEESVDGNFQLSGLLVTENILFVNEVPEQEAEANEG